MRLERRPAAACAGLRLAHAQSLGGRRLPKGQVLSPEDCVALQAAGLDPLTVAVLDEDEQDEDSAARALALPLAAGSGLRLSFAPGGRANLSATAAGLVRLDAARVHRFNRQAESLTLATLPDLARASPGQVLATLKIIPFAVPQALVQAGAEILAEGGPILSLSPFRPDRGIVLIQTLLPVLKPAMLQKTAEIQAGRLAALGQRLLAELRLPHAVAPLAAALMAEARAGRDLILVQGASAICDRGDVIPAAIEAAGGEIRHFGMPVDPGNLLLLGRVGATEIVGLPGCARSPAENGFDWVLERLLAGLPLGPEEIMAMGVGGLLKDTPARGIARVETVGSGPQPLAALLLAAGSGSRMGPEGKLLLPWPGAGSLVEASAANVEGLDLAERVAVIGPGPEGAAIAAKLAPQGWRMVVNPDPGRGQASSLGLGLRALGEGIAATLVLLGDMPMVPPSVAAALAAGFDPVEGRVACIPVHQGRRGNPVLVGRRLWAEILEVEGDRGARPVLARYPELVAEIPAGTDAIHQDLDDPEAYRAALAAAGG